MDSEKDLQWQPHTDNSLLTNCSEDDDDKKSISSESSGEGLPLDLPSLPKIYQINEQDLWNHPVNDVEHIVQKLPNANKIMENIVSAKNLNEIVIANDEVNTALLLSVLFGHNELVLKLLTEFYADVNTVDFMGRTALHLACSTSNSCVAKILLDHGAEVNRWDKLKNTTALHCAARSGSVECIQQLLRRGAYVNAGIEKRSALHMTVEKNCLKCIETLLKYGANPNTPQVYTETPLHTAAGMGYKEAMELLLKHGADARSQYGKRRATALHLAAEDNYTDCVQLLLENGAEVNARNANNQTALHLACLAQCVETVEVLIKYNADVNAVYKDGRTALHAAIVKESKCFECAKLLLIAGVDVNRSDNYGYTALHIAALNEFSSCTYMLIEYGADITARTNGGVSALSFIVRRTPEVIPKFLSKFDSSITVNEHEIGDVDCEIKLDFKLLVPNTERGETELLLAFIEVGKKRILKHPLCETFLFLKWRRIRKFFLFSLFYHALYVLLFTLYILGVYDKDCSFDTMETNEPHCKAPSYVSPVGYSIIFMNFVFLGKEFFQMAHGFSSYVRYWENWIQWTIIIGVFLCATPNTMISRNLKSIPVWQHHVAAIVIFLVWLELMMLVGRFPIFGLYVQMFTKVAVNFSKFLLAYCCLLVAFGLSFGVLFANYKAFQYVPWTMLKTVTMMAGELEFEDIFYGDTPILYPVTAHGMFFTFVLLVTVILTNLLVGLAVSDIQGLQASAGLDRLSRQAELVSRLESLLFSKLLRKAPPAVILLFQRNALLRTSRYHLHFCIRPNDPRDTRLPKDIILSIYKLVAERRDRNQSLKRRKREQNMRYFARSYDEDFGGGPSVQLRNHSAHVQSSSPRTHSAQPPSPAVVHNMYANTAAVVPPPQIHNNAEVEKNMDMLKLQMQEVYYKLNDMQNTFAKKLAEISKELTMARRKLEEQT